MNTYMTRLIIELATKKDRSKNRDQNKDQYRDDSYDKNRGKSIDYLYNDDRYGSELERVHKIFQMMSQEKEMSIGFMLVFSKNPDKLIDSDTSFFYI